MEIPFFNESYFVYWVFTGFVENLGLKQKKH